MLLYINKCKMNWCWFSVDHVDLDLLVHLRRLICISMDCQHLQIQRRQETKKHFCISKNYNLKKLLLLLSMPYRLSYLNSPRIAKVKWKLSFFIFAGITKRILTKMCKQGYRLQIEFRTFAFKLEYKIYCRNKSNELLLLFPCKCRRKKRKLILLRVSSLRKIFLEEEHP
jgi:hypothetical protein